MSDINLINQPVNKLLFTVFTPTYNRKDLLLRLYDSLQKQTCRNFEWIIIDDGSTDGTEDLVKQIQLKTDLTIVYQWQTNKGKHMAINAVAKIARGELFIISDSDDELVPNALERLKHYWDAFTIENKSTVAGVFFLCKDQYGKLVGDKFPEDYQIMDLVGMGISKRISGEKGAMLQTSVLKMYPFPENLNNCYVPEGTLWAKMAKDWKMCFINEALRIYWIEGRSDSLSLISTTIKNYPGAHYYHLCFLNYNMRFFLKRPKLCMGEATRYIRLSLHLGFNLKTQFYKLIPVSAKILWALCLPLGVLFYYRDKASMK